jgi:O-antigen ligase
MLSFVFIPIATFFLSEKVKGNNKLIIYTFLLSSSLAAFYCLGIAFSNSYIINEQGNGFCWSVSGDFCGYSFLRLILLRKSFFSYRYFSQLHHATYFAMYITFVIGVLFYIFSKMKRVKWLITYALGILFFLFINFLLASRAGYITTVLLIVFSFVWFFHYKVKRRYIIIGTIVLLFAAGFLLMKTRLGNNMQEVVALIFEEEVPKENLDPRLLLWNVGVDLAREAPIWGYGVGDVHDKLDELYEERGMYKELVQHFNVHNQYLSVYLATGILGLGVLLYWFFGSLILGIRTRNYLLSVFMLIIIINALFENILDRSAGLAFILLFYPILMHQSLQKKRDDT